MVHIQVEVGLGKQSLQDLQQALMGQRSGLIQGLAPACGLILVAVTYPD